MRWDFGTGDTSTAERTVWTHHRPMSCGQAGEIIDRDRRVRDGLEGRIRRLRRERNAAVVAAVAVAVAAVAVAV